MYVGVPPAPAPLLLPPTTLFNGQDFEGGLVTVVEDEEEDEEEECEELESDDASDVGGELFHITHVHFPFMHPNV
jgi:hypothetical protein